MLSKITKSIGFGVIIGLNGLCSYGNRIDVFYEGGPTLVAEGIDGVELPQELSDWTHELWNEYDDKFEYIGIKFNFPEGIIQICEDEYWKIYNEEEKQELEKLIHTEETFHDWCSKQERIDYPDHYFYCRYAYLFKIANKKNYTIPWDFCKKIELGLILDTIHLKGAIRCMPDYTTPIGKYIRSFIRNVTPNSIF